jgi:hypothetical protein
MKRIFQNKWAVALMVIVLAIIATIAIVFSPISGELGIDSGLFNKEGCKAPCWNDLTPGQSTSEDVDAFLAALPKTQWPNRETYEYDTGCKSIRLVDKFGIGTVYLDVVDGNLTFIRSYPPNKTRLGKIVDFFGDPEYFEALLYIGYDYSVYTLEIYYPRKGLAFEISTEQEKDLGMSEGDILKNLPGQEKISSTVGADMVVSAIHYFEPGDLLSYYQSRYPCPVNEADTLRSVQSSIENFIQEWSGFGEMDVMIDSELQ